MVKIHQCTHTVCPGVKKRFKTNVKIKINRIGFRPFKTNRIGTWDSKIVTARRPSTMPYPWSVLTKKASTIKAIASTILIRASSLWITDSAGKY